jgi:23S rRNA (guanosine2251-2'-O)-methyltransferase
MIVYGRNTVIEALNSSHNCEELFLQLDLKVDEKINKILDLSSKENIPIRRISSKEIKKITSSEETQGVALKLNFKESNIKDLLKANSNGVIYISDATYEHNIGAIIRTAECAGFSGVIIPSDIKITPTIAKISTGAVFNIPIVSYSIFNAIKVFKENGYFIYGIERGGKNLFESSTPLKSLFIIGSEDKGLSKPVADKCDEILEIPQFGKVNSLNMSVASAIVIYNHLKNNFSEITKNG